VYANKPFRQGEVIEVSRGLLLPEEAMGGAGHIEEFAWFSEAPAGAAPLARIGIDQDGDPVLVPPGIALLACSIPTLFIDRHGFVLVLMRRQFAIHPFIHLFFHQYLFYWCVHALMS